MFQKALTLINQINQNNVCFFIISILKILVLDFNHMHAMDAMIYQWWFIILNIKGVDYRCFVCNMSKNTAIKLLNNSQLDDKCALRMWILAQIKHPLK